MTAVRIAAHIAQLTGAPQVCDAAGTTVAELIHDLDSRYRGLASLLLLENGSLRQHVDIKIDEKAITDREKLMDQVPSNSQVVFQQFASKETEHSARASTEENSAPTKRAG